jgi:hypothetical protein
LFFHNQHSYHINENNELKKRNVALETHIWGQKA